MAKGGEVGAKPGVEIALADGDVSALLGVEPDLMAEAVDHEREEARRPPVGILVGAGAAVGSDETDVDGAVDVGEIRPAIRAIVGVTVAAAVGEPVVGDKGIDGGLDPRGQEDERVSRGGLTRSGMTSRARTLSGCVGCDRAATSEEVVEAADSRRQEE